MRVFTVIDAFNQGEIVKPTHRSLDWISFVGQNDITNYIRYCGLLIYPCKLQCSIKRFLRNKSKCLSITCKVKPWSQSWLIAAGAYPGFCSMKRLEVFLLPLDGMLVHRRSHPRNFARFPQQFAGTHLYTWVERGTVRVKCLAQEHNTMFPARARTRTVRSGVERTNHEASAPPTCNHITNHAEKSKIIV